jgi:hypothetical protein
MNPQNGFAQVHLFERDTNAKFGKLTSATKQHRFYGNLRNMLMAPSFQTAPQTAD